MDIVRSVLGALYFDPVVFLSQLVLFYVMHLLLTPILYKPLQRVRVEREALTGGKVKEAERLNALALELKAKYESGLKAAKSKAVATVAAARQEAEAARMTRLEEARTAAEAVIDKAQREVARERAEALASLQKEVPKMAVATALRLLGSTCSEEHNARVARRIREAS